MLRVLELFAGYGSQSLSLMDLGIEHKVVGISEIDIDAIIGYGAIRYNLEDIKLDSNLTVEAMRNELITKNIGKDFNTGEIKVVKLKEDKLIKLYKFNKVINNLGDISILDTDKIPDCDYITYSFPCFVAGSKILTEEGYKNIEDITSQDRVLTHTNTYKQVVKPMVNKADHIYELSCMCSDTLQVTEEHPFYVRKRYWKYNNSLGRHERLFKEPEWVKVKDLNKDYYVGVAINQNSNLPSWNGSIFTWSDGRCSRKSDILSNKFKLNDFWWLIGRYMGDGWLGHDGGIIICCKDSETEDITSKLDNLDLHYSLSKEHTFTKIHICYKELGEYVAQFGRGASNKRLTKDILDLPRDLLESLIIGYESADGYIDKVGIHRITSVSKELIYGIAQCIAKVYKRPYSIYYTKRNTTCVIEGRVVNTKDTYLLLYKTTTNKQDKAFYDNGYLWFPIRKIIKKDYNDLVYNMEVEEDNSYTVNNVIVHNCTDISTSGKQDGVVRCKTRSGLLYECEKIIEAKLPKYLLMENVANLLSTKFKPVLVYWSAYLETLGYSNYCFLADPTDFGVAQTRRRVFMVSIRNDTSGYIEPTGFKLEKRLSDYLELDVGKKYYLSDSTSSRFNQSSLDIGKSNIIGSTKPECRTIGQRDVVYGLNANTMGCLVASDWKQPKQVMCKGNSGIVFTLVDGRYVRNDNGGDTYKIRRLTPREYLRLMGVKDNYIDRLISVGLGDNALYKMAGNSIVVDVLNAIHSNMFIEVDTEGF